MARATSAPNLALTLFTMAVVVVKSLSRTFKITRSALSNGFSTMRSTVAPCGILEAVGTPMTTLLPAAAVASMPVAFNEPCEMA